VGSQNVNPARRDAGRRQRLPAALEKSLGRYAVLAGAALASSQASLHAAPLTFVFSPPVDALSFNFIDVNNDGIMDLLFSGLGSAQFFAAGMTGNVSGFISGSFGCSGLYFRSNQVAIDPQGLSFCFSGSICISGTGPRQLLQLQSGDTVDQSLFYDHQGDNGTWIPPGDGYLGFRFDLIDGTHYGYLKIDPFQIESATFETDPNVGIQIGDTAVPEPGSLGMLALGAVAAGLLRRKRLPTSRPLV
jgi:hypothetical protein